MFHCLTADEIHVSVKLHKGEVSERNLAYLTALILSSKGMIDETVLKEIQYQNAKGDDIESFKESLVNP